MFVYVDMTPGMSLGPVLSFCLVSLKQELSLTPELASGWQAVSYSQPHSPQLRDYNNMHYHVGLWWFFFFFHGFWRFEPKSSFMGNCLSYSYSSLQLGFMFLKTKEENKTKTKNETELILCGRDCIVAFKL